MFRLLCYYSMMMKLRLCFGCGEIRLYWMRICSLSYFCDKERVCDHTLVFCGFLFPFSVPHLILVTGFQIFPGKIIRDFMSGFCKHLLCHLKFNVRIFLCCVNLVVFDVPMLKLFCLGVIDCTKKKKSFCTKMWTAVIYYMCMCTL